MGRLFYELTLSSNMTNDVSLTADMAYLYKLNRVLPTKKGNYKDFFSPNLTFKLITKLKMPEGKKFPDFDYKPNYDRSKNYVKTYTEPVTGNRDKKGKLSYSKDKRRDR